MRRLLLAAALGLLIAAPAHATTIVYECESDICAAEPDGSKQRNLTRKLSGDYSSPRLSSDGRTLAFVRSGGLYVADRNARNQRLLPPPQPNYAGAAPSSPFLTRDGSEILFVNGNRITGTSHICRIRTARGSKPRCGKDGSHGRNNIAWGPGRTTVSTSEEHYRDICVTSLEGRCTKTLVRLPRDGDKHFAYEPSLSPDGRFFAVNVQWPDNLRIRLFDARTGRYVRDLAGPAGGFRPAWSPSGRNVAFERYESTSSLETRFSVCTVSARGGKVRCPIVHVIGPGGSRPVGVSWGG